MACRLDAVVRRAIENLPFTPPIAAGNDYDRSPTIIVRIYRPYMQFSPDYTFVFTVSGLVMALDFDGESNETIPHKNDLFTISHSVSFQTIPRSVSNAKKETPLPSPASAPFVRSITDDPFTKGSRSKTLTLALLQQVTEISRETNLIPIVWMYLVQPGIKNNDFRFCIICNSPHEHPICCVD